VVTLLSVSHHYHVADSVCAVASCTLPDEEGLFSGKPCGLTDLSGREIVPPKYSDIRDLPNLGAILRPPAATRSELNGLDAMLITDVLKQNRSTTWEPIFIELTEPGTVNRLEIECSIQPQNVPTEQKVTLAVRIIDEVTT